jgi:hypothetical protein
MAVHQDSRQIVGTEAARHIGVSTSRNTSKSKFLLTIPKAIVLFGDF